MWCVCGSIDLYLVAYPCTQGFIHPYKSTYKATNNPQELTPNSHPMSLPSSSSGPQMQLAPLTLSSLSPNPSEVQQVIHLPLSFLLFPSRLRSHNLPARPPYWAIDVTDLIRPDLRDCLPKAPGFPDDGDEAGPGDSSAAPKIVVWGLTAHYMNELMQRLKMLWA